ncbi:MAG: hypothetical protein FWC09_04555 [Lachnospiraceae bacterium]|nr:hypothetical protein [Lachnospiraceae bacterium]
MISKNSFWVDIRENNKRRTWVWVVSWVFFLLYYIIGLTLIINSQKNYYAAFDRQKEKLVEAVAEFLGAPYFLIFGAVIFSVFSVIQGFGYLYKKRQLDFYHSLPVKKSRRFFVIWLNGILIYVIPSIVSLCIGITIAAIQGYMTFNTLLGIGLMYLLAVAVYISIYHLNMVALMLTGHIVISFLGMIILHSYEVIIKQLQYIYMQQFFQKFVAESISETIFTAPFYWLIAFFDIGDSSFFIWTLPIIFVQAGVYFAIAYFIYCKRPAEACGRALAFKGTQPFVKIAIALPMALYIAMLFWEITSYGSGSNGNLALVMVGLTIATVITCCVFEVIYEFDIKAVLKKKRHILISGIIAAMIFMIFRFDMTGYDNYVPKQNSISSYALILDSYYFGYYQKAGINVRKNQYITDKMFATDTENIHTLAMIQPDEQTWMRAEVLYRLKSGRTVRRKIWLDFDNPQTIPVLDRITATDDFKKANYMVMADYFDDLWFRDIEGLKREITYNFGIYTYQISAGDLNRIITAYRQDMQSINYSRMRNSLSYGQIRLYWERIYPDEYYDQMHMYYPRSFSFEIMEDNIRTRAVLSELGFSEKPLNASDVKYISVFRAGGMIDYYEADEIEAIVASIWLPPNTYNHFEHLLDTNYTVYLNLEEEITFNRNNPKGSWQFLAGKTPEFIQSYLFSSFRAEGEESQLR